VALFVVQHLLQEATHKLHSVSDTPRLDAELLLAAALGVERQALLLQAGRLHPSPVQLRVFAAYLARRQAHEPVAYILEAQEFWSLPLRVTPAVLIPRADSETLIEAALAYFKACGSAPRTILDLGSGSGALLLAALTEWPHAQGLGVDASLAALAIARENAEKLALASRAQFQQGDWGAGLAAKYDLILCNPPYVEISAALAKNVQDYEPHSALYAGAEGMDDYHRIIPQLPQLLAPQGIACVEIGWQQAEAVSALGAAHGLHSTLHQDLAGHSRCVCFQV
jgi:release factor glutamine methyltransferase